MKKDFINEPIIYNAEMHWGVYLKAIIFFLMSLSLIIPICLVGLYPSQFFDVYKFLIYNCLWLSIALFVFLFSFIKSFIKAIMARIRTRYILTETRLVMKSRDLTEIFYVKCDSISLDQSILGKIFGYGTVIVATGGTVTELEYVADPFTFKSLIDKQITNGH